MRTDRHCEPNSGRNIHTYMLSEHNQVDYVDCKLCAKADVTLIALIRPQPN